MDSKTIIAEFTRSVNKAIEKRARVLNENELFIQVSIEYVNDRIFFVAFKNYSNRFLLKPEDVLILSPVYVMFRGQILEKLERMIRMLALKENMKRLNVVFTKSSKGAGAIRAMLFNQEAGYVRDISLEEIVSL